jgi:hypothetical protein
MLIVTWSEDNQVFEFKDNRREVAVKEFPGVSL